MAKGYWIASIDVQNMDGYRAYIAANGAVFHKYGAKFLVRGGEFETREGTSRSRNVVLEFEDWLGSSSGAELEIDARVMSAGGRLHSNPADSGYCLETAVGPLLSELSLE